MGKLQDFKPSRCDKVREKSVYVDLMEFSLWQYMGRVDDKVHGLCCSQSNRIWA